MRPSRAAALILCLLLFTTSAVGTAITHAGPTETLTDPEHNNSSALYLSDDPDPEAGDVPHFSPLPLSVLANSNVSKSNSVRAYDFYYLAAHPFDRIDRSQLDALVADQTFQEYRESAHQSVASPDNTSIWPANGVSVQDNGLIRDAYIDVTSVNNGYLHSSNSSQVRVIPDSGAVYTTLDYRIAIPDGDCEVTETEKVCTQFKLVDGDTSRTLEIGDESYTGATNSDEAGVLSYSEAPTGAEKATVKATISVDYQRTTKVWDRTNTTDSWTLNGSTTTPLSSTTVVEDNFETQVASDQSITVQQRIINRDGEKNVVVLDFEGPRTLSDRRLWSYAEVSENVLVENVWGLYSAHHRKKAQRATNEEPTPERTGFRSMPDVYLLAPKTAPKTLFVGADPAKTAESGQVHVTNLRTGEYDSPGPLITNENISLPETTPQRVDAMVIEGVDDEVNAVYDLHNQEIPVNTFETEYRETTLKIENLNGDRAAVHLTDEDGEPVANRRVQLNLPEDRYVRTNETGKAVFETERTRIRAQFTGDNFLDRHETYYGESRTAATLPTEDPYYTQLLRLALAQRNYPTYLLIGLTIIALTRT
jgi:hypothetical protein